MKRSAALIAVLFAWLAPAASAAELDGSKPMLCAMQSAFDCVHRGGCEALELEPGDDFWKIDVGKKVLGTLDGGRTSPISEVKQNAGQLFLHGDQNDRFWNLVIDQETGRMSAAVVDAEGTFALAGSCITAP